METLPMVSPDIILNLSTAEATRFEADAFGCINLIWSLWTLFSTFSSFAELDKLTDCCCVGGTLVHVRSEHHTHERACYPYPVCRTAVCRTLTLWAQLWRPTRPTWRSWSWVRTGCRIQACSGCGIIWGVHSADWRLWGQAPFLDVSLTMFWATCSQWKILWWLKTLSMISFFSSLMPELTEKKHFYSTAAWM